MQAILHLVRSSQIIYVIYVLDVLGRILLEEVGDVGRAVEFASETQENHRCHRSRVASEENVDRIRSWEWVKATIGSG